MKRIAPVVAILLGALCASTASAQDPDEGEVEYMFYTVKPGDSCKSLAQKFFGASKSQDRLIKHNPGLQCDAKLTPEMALRVPKPKPDAEVTATLRNVQARGRRDTDWFGAPEGTDLWGGWRVNTLERSAAEVTFRDKSLVQLRQNTLVIIYGGTRSASRAKPSRAELESGALRSRLDEFSGGLEVETPGATAQLSGGNTLLTVDEDKTARVANHGGNDVSVRSKSGGKVKVKDGMGSKVLKGKRPQKPKPLPPTPAWSTGPRVFLGTALGGGNISGEWMPVDKATAYRVEVTRDARGVGVVAAATVPATVTAFEIQDLPTGDYYVSVASIDDDAFESKPSGYEPMSITLVSINGPGGTEVIYTDGSAGSERAAPMVLPGATVTVSGGIVCRQAGSDQARATEVVLSGSGPVALDCVDAEQKVVAPFSINVATLEVAANTQGSEVVELIAGAENEVTIEIDSPIALPDELEVEAPKGIKVVGLRRVDERHWILTLTPKRRMVGEDKVRLGLGGQPLSTLSVTTRPPEAQDAPEPEGPEFHIVEAGVAGGITLIPDDHEFFSPDLATGQQPFAGPVGDFGLRLAYHPIRFVGAEIEFRLLPGRFDDGSRTLLYGFGGHLVGQLHTRFTPFLLVGGGASGIFGGAANPVGADLDGNFYFGGGLKFYASKRVMLRVDVRDYVAPRFGDDGLTNLISITGGLSVVFGRKTANRPKRSSE